MFHVFLMIIKGIINGSVYSIIERYSYSIFHKSLLFCGYSVYFSLTVVLGRTLAKLLSV